MAHAEEDPVIRSQTDDGTTGNDVRLISHGDEELGGGGYNWHGFMPQPLM